MEPPLSTSLNPHFVLLAFSNPFQTLLRQTKLGFRGLEKKKMDQDNDWTKFISDLLEKPDSQVRRTIEVFPFF